MVIVVMMVASNSGYDNNSDAEGVLVMTVMESVGSVGIVSGVIVVIMVIVVMMVVGNSGYDNGSGVLVVMIMGDDSNEGLLVMGGASSCGDSGDDGGW